MDPAGVSIHTQAQQGIQGGGWVLAGEQAFFPCVSNHAYAATRVKHALTPQLRPSTLHSFAEQTPSQPASIHPRPRGRHPSQLPVPLLGARSIISHRDDPLICYLRENNQTFCNILVVRRIRVRPTLLRTTPRDRAIESCILFGPSWSRAARCLAGHVNPSVATPTYT